MEETQMATMTTIQDPERVQRIKAVQDASRHFQRHVEDFRQKKYRYVVLHGATIIATGDSPEAAQEKARENGHDDDLCVTLLVPQPGESFYF